MDLVLASCPSFGVDTLAILALVAGGVLLVFGLVAAGVLKLVFMATRAGSASPQQWIGLSLALLGACGGFACAALGGGVVAFGVGGLMLIAMFAGWPPARAQTLSA
jgi:hypothetical protein